MLPGAVHAFLPGWTILLDIAELTGQNVVEVIQMFLGPLDASTHHQGRKALLVYMYGILDQGEINKGYLEDVVVKIAFKENLTSSFGNDMTSRSKKFFSCHVVKI